MRYLLLGAIVASTFGAATDRLNRLIELGDNLSKRDLVDLYTNPNIMAELEDAIRAL
jgi:hypothetical protein